MNGTVHSELLDTGLYIDLDLKTGEFASSIQIYIEPAWITGDGTTAFVAVKKSFTA